MPTSAPASSTLITSSGVCTPLVAASDCSKSDRRMAIQRSGSSSSSLLLSTRRGSTARVSRSMSGWRKRLNSTRPSAPVLTSRLAMLAIELKYGPDLDGQGNGNCPTDAGNQVEVLVLDLAGRHVEVGGQK